MKITVATRVIGGFVAISALLIVISVVSLYNLNSIGSATEEVNDVALPTVAGSNALKASFLNMGRLTFESYIEEDLNGLKDKRASFNSAKDTFESEYKKLAQAVNNEPELKSTLNTVRESYEAYITNVEAMYKNHQMYLDIRNTIQDRLGDAEDNADDASTYLLDFSDLDAVQRDPNLRRAAEIGSQLETSLLSLLTVSYEYIKTETLVRSQTLGNEVDLVVEKVVTQLSDMMQTAGGRDDSGTLDDINDLVNNAINAIKANDGVVQLHVDRLERRNDAEKALNASDSNIAQAVVALENLLNLADKKASHVESQVNGAIATGNTFVIVVVIISIAVAAFIGYVTVRAITRPLYRVNELLTVASSGDLTHRLDDSAQDEFGLLARNCNTLIGNLKELITAINVRAEQLAAASEQTSAVTAQTTHSIQDQKSQIGQVATATTEMHSTSQLVVQNAEDTLSQIRHADAEAENVRQISLENKNTIEILSRDVQEAADVINKLHQDSASIGGILDVIRGVADQTNLLALNAAIEAARAGEQGRGFAVVADEVRTLASRTQESTQEINAMIEVLQAGAEKAVSVMNQGKEQTAACVAQTEKATQALDIISDAVHKAHDVSSQIEQSAREQNTVSQEISEKLETIVGIAEETTAGAQQTSESSHEVARLAEELQQSIRQFKV
ncbi:methyl-accepting chemotaxis protein [Alteromonas macleodii]|jgi:methyl-accepting chemotaxis protein|uniref:Methyl-accepting chemotaxis (MCP) signaling domain protein n=1 Tax=Alteromonas macleodii TaxID=28108 RepID=A0A1E7DI91_ALTMA|nr:MULTISPECIES: methyl-accepting chemotaxis protein [Alteromonas]MCP3702312.1 methyl-accepting chemotaxis protein [Alteromonas sp.]MEC7080855.1 methyl-accepting chemotaxis protein [Pseudomonadota bacterium]NKX21597.1 methyl-accepting chemotaxis protein [Alteromonadaceae bacterium A_SAG2]NKX30865.1 methyl-accepting chemotaxis protein [Alteromonadaceae bacterium A_SAG1]AFS36188.1 methyl-accepting chemotaxis protein [Alteromonas macleodii ATCC 27126]|tara:strand:+ start:2756 stop:4780 length:2025 start_codon:yes stop_codon:yes gene_type:complete